MTTQLVKRKLIDIDAVYIARYFEKRERLLWKVVNFKQLMRRVETAQTVTIAHNLVRKIAANSRHTLQKGGIGCI